MTCVFCGSSEEMTKEHVFPDWLNAHLPGDRPHWVLEQDRFGGERPFEVRRKAKGLDFQVRAVCRLCNNGWMSRLEGEAKPLLERLMAGVTLQPVTKEDQIILASWATKTAMIIDSMEEVSVIPQRDRTLFFKRRTIPRRAWIWLGACEEKLPLTMSHSMTTEIEPIDGGERLRGFFTPIKVGHLIIYWVLPGKRVEIDLQRPWSLGATQIFPKPKSTLWPMPMHLADGAAFDALVDGFWFDLLINDPSRPN